MCTRCAGEYCVIALEEIRARTEQAYTDEEQLRLVLLTLALMERHQVNDKGRCRYCRPERRWWRRQRRCLVLPLVAFYLQQPTRLLQNAGNAHN